MTRPFLVCAIALAFTACSDGASTAPDLGPEATIGRAFVAQRGCPMCHQAKDSTDVLAGGVEVMPGVFSANLTPDATGLGNWADITIVRAMRYGTDDEQEQLCPTMPHFDGSDPKFPFMTDVEADAIVAYLRSLPPVKNEVQESECPPVKPRPPVDMAVPPVEDVDMSMVQNND